MKGIYTTISFAAHVAKLPRTLGKVPTRQPSRQTIWSNLFAHWSESLKWVVNQTKSEAPTARCQHAILVARRLSPRLAPPLHWCRQFGATFGGLPGLDRANPSWQIEARRLTAKFDSRLLRQRYRQKVNCPPQAIHALTGVLQAVGFAPRLVLPAGIVMQRIIALQRPALHELRSRELLPIVMLL